MWLVGSKSVTKFEYPVEKWRFFQCCRASFDTWNERTEPTIPIKHEYTRVQWDGLAKCNEFVWSGGLWKAENALDTTKIGSLATKSVTRKEAFKRHENSARRTTIPSRTANMTCRGLWLTFWNPFNLSIFFWIPVSLTEANEKWRLGWGRVGGRKTSVRWLGVERLWGDSSSVAKNVLLLYFVSLTVLGIYCKYGVLLIWFHTKHFWE